MFSLLVTACLATHEDSSTPQETANETPTESDVDASAWYIDADEDGYGFFYGDVAVSVEAPPGMVSNADDCDDSDASVNPGAIEVCNGIDDDCDDDLDDDDDDLDESTTGTWYVDADGDGYGYGGEQADTQACDPLTGMAREPDDCDDEHPQVHPGAAELCDGMDNDCDDALDEGAGVGFRATDGVVTDLTDDFLTGTEATPADVLLETPGELRVCGGSTTPTSCSTPTSR